MFAMISKYKEWQSKMRLCQMGFAAIETVWAVALFSTACDVLTL